MRASAQTATSIDTARGPLTGSTRRIGLGGAFVALADDSEGVAINPASVALRLPYSWSWWDYGFGVDFSIGGWLPKNDLYNQGTDGTGKSSALFGSLAAVLYAGHFGVGAAAEAQSNAASRPQEEQGVARNFSANFGMVHSSAAYGFLDNQLLIGAGARFVGMSFDARGSGGALSTAGAGYTAGVTYKPAAHQYRIAAAYKSSIRAEVPGEAGEDPTRVDVPWELALGFTYQWGRRVMNPRFVSVDEVARGYSGGAEPSKEDRKRAERQLFEDYQRRQRRYVLVSTELSVIQGDADHVGVERLWTKSGTASAGRPVILPRVGVEAEVVPHVLRLRAGSYYEAERVNLKPVRLHGTGGLDVRLFRWNVFGLIGPFDYWQLSVAADAARAYLNTSFSIGFWH
ncbi:MAG: hypothetical protein EOO73_11325 [Myxococcales bacterium]|nr:MAG: hypothetical protein EOO73_11325 [Myxococcales bacterium]